MSRLWGKTFMVISWIMFYVEGYAATAQRIIGKNNEAWKSFPALRRLEAEGNLPKRITRVSMLRFWKRNGKRELG